MVSLVTDSEPPEAWGSLVSRTTVVSSTGRAATSGARDERIVVGALVVDAAAREATLDGDPIQLSPKEFELLAYLAERSGEVVSKRQLLAEVWRQPWGGSDKTVDVHLSWLRKKLGESAAESRYLQTVHGVGIKLVEPS